MPRGKSRSNNRGKSRAFSSPDEIDRDLAGLGLEDLESSSSISPEDEENSDSDDDRMKKPKGVSNLIEIENPNRKPKTAGKEPAEEEEAPQLSRREREQLQKVRSREHYQKLTEQGKTDQAKADLARLAIIRKQREDASQKRAQEIKQKEEDVKAKREQTARALGKK